MLGYESRGKLNNISTKTKTINLKKNKKQRNKETKKQKKGKEKKERVCIFFSDLGKDDA